MQEDANRLSQPMYRWPWLLSSPRKSCPKSASCDMSSCVDRGCTRNPKRDHRSEHDRDSPRAYALAHLVRMRWFPSGRRAFRRRAIESSDAPLCPKKVSHALVRSDHPVCSCEARRIYIRALPSSQFAGMPTASPQSARQVHRPPEPRLPQSPKAVSSVIESPVEIRTGSWNQPDRQCPAVLPHNNIGPDHALHSRGANFEPCRQQHRYRNVHPQHLRSLVGRGWRHIRERDERLLGSNLRRRLAEYEDHRYRRYSESTCDAHSDPCAPAPPNNRSCGLVGTPVIRPAFPRLAEQSETGLQPFH